MSSSSRLASLLLVACHTHTSTPEPTRDTIVLTPVLVVGSSFVYHVEASIEASQQGAATVTLDDKVEVIAADRVRDTFSNVEIHGDGELAKALESLAPEIAHASATTSFDATWQVVATTIDGTAVDDARTMIMNLAPTVSFRMLPGHEVAVGDSWRATWAGSLRSQDGSDAGKVATGVQYKLDAIESCGDHKCVEISADGEDDIPAHDGLSGRSTFHGEQRIDAGNALPITKLVRTATTMRGEVEYTNAVTVRVTRTTDVALPNER